MIPLYVTYEVAALVIVPSGMDYRIYGGDSYVLSAGAFQKETNSSTPLHYAFDVKEGAAPAMETYLAAYTQNEGAQYDYESKETHRAEFEGFRNMFMLLGGVLSAVVGMVGILNFLNAVLTSIITRRKEFAMLQSIGMTGKQLKRMLIWESLLYTVSAVLFCFVLNLAASPLLGAALEGVFWFFAFKLTVLPILLCLPIMVLISLLVPHFGYQSLVKQSIVVRLREEAA